MKKLIYLVLSVLFAISGIYGIYDTITTPKYDLATSIMTVLPEDERGSGEARKAIASRDRSRHL